jgi:hypothetical protein
MNIWMRLVGAIKRPKHWANAAADKLKMVSCRVHTDEVRIVLKNLEQVEDFFYQRGEEGRDASIAIQIQRGGAHHRHL